MCEITEETKPQIQHIIMPTKKEITAHRHHWVDLYKKSNGCYLCGYNRHPSALCFDVLPEFKVDKKRRGMYNLYDASVPLSELISEIMKCRILCCNCHIECTKNNNTRTLIVTREQISLDTLYFTLKSYEEHG